MNINTLKSAIFSLCDKALPVILYNADITSYYPLKEIQKCPYYAYRTSPLLMEPMLY